MILKMLKRQPTQQYCKTNLFSRRALVKNLLFVLVAHLPSTQEFVIKNKTLAKPSKSQQTRRLI